MYRGADGEQGRRMRAVRRALGMQAACQCAVRGGHSARAVMRAVRGGRRAREVFRAARRAHGMQAVCWAAGLGRYGS